MDKYKIYALWFFKIIISILFVLASLGKLTMNERVIEMFRDWGYFDGFYFFIGIIELVLAIALFIPRTSYYAAVGLFVVMIGALITHIVNDPLGQLIRPIVFMLLLIPIILWQRKKVQSGEQKRVDQVDVKHQNFRLPNHLCIQASKHPSTQAPKHPSTQAFKHQSIQASKHPSIQAPKHQSIQAFKHQSIKAFKHPSIQAPKHPSTQAFKHPSI